MAIGSVLPDTVLVLDTNILTAWRYGDRNVQQEIADYLSRHKIYPALTSMTVFEALHGFEKLASKSGGLDERTKQDRTKVEQLIRLCGILSFDENAAEIAAYIVPRLKHNKLLRDVFIAATVLASGRGKVTRNKKDFEQIANHLPPSHALLRLAVW